jgi:hypothetical protein
MKRSITLRNICSQYYILPKGKCWRAEACVSIATEAHVPYMNVCYSQEFLSLILLQLRYSLIYVHFFPFSYPGGTAAECRLVGEEAGLLG